MQNQPKSPLDYIVEILRSDWFYLLLIAFLIIFPHLVGWVTGEGPYGVEVRGRLRYVGQSLFWQSIIIEVLVFVILAMSYNLMFGFTGVISFGHALFFGLGGFTVGIMMDRMDLVDQIGLQPTFWSSILVALVLSGIIGFVMGLVSLRLKGVYFAIFTLAVAEMGFIWTSRWAYTDAEDGFPLQNMPEFLNPSRNRLNYYYITLVITVLCFLLIRRLMNSPTGRVMLAIRENEDRAQAIGFNTLRYKLLSITVASMMASLAGIIHVVLNKKVGPEIMSTQFTIEPLLMTIIGGIGTFSGPVLGASFLHLSERILNREFVIGGLTLNVGEYWSLILGIVFIVVVLIFPQGFVGTVRGWLSDWRNRGKPKTRDSETVTASGD